MSKRADKEWGEMWSKDVEHIGEKASEENMSDE
jgi:hypothetical protein